MYENAKRSGMDSLGGARAFYIAGPTIRRLAVADAVLSTLALLGEDIRDETVRRLLNDLYSTFRADVDFQD